MKLLFVLLAMSPLTLSAEQYIDDAEIISITTRNNGFHSIFVSKPIGNNENCSHWDRLIINENEIGSKSMLSLAIFAMSSKSKISVRYDSCDNIDPRFANFKAPKISRLKVN